jgi:hypothetical protein
MIHRQELATPLLYRHVTFTSKSSGRLNSFARLLLAANSAKSSPARWTRSLTLTLPNRHIHLETISLILMHLPALQSFAAVQARAWTTADELMILSRHSRSSLRRIQLYLHGDSLDGVNIDVFNSFTSLVILQLNIWGDKSVFSRQLGSRLQLDNLKVLHWNYENAADSSSLGILSSSRFPMLEYLLMSIHEMDRGSSLTLLKRFFTQHTGLRNVTAFMPSGLVDQLLANNVSTLHLELAGMFCEPRPAIVPLLHTCTRRLSFPYVMSSAYDMADFLHAVLLAPSSLGLSEIEMQRTQSGTFSWDSFVKMSLERDKAGPFGNVLRHALALQSRGIKVIDGIGKTASLNLS